jgi:hypothetical protein
VHPGLPIEAGEFALANILEWSGLDMNSPLYIRKLFLIPQGVGGGGRRQVQKGQKLEPTFQFFLFILLL